MERLASALQFGVVGVVERFEVVVILLRQDLMLQQLFGAVELQIGAGGFNSCFLEIGAGLGSVAALQGADTLALVDFLPG